MSLPRATVKAEGSAASGSKQSSLFNFFGKPTPGRATGVAPSSSVSASSALRSGRESPANTFQLGTPLPDSRKAGEVSQLDQLNRSSSGSSSSRQASRSFGDQGASASSTNARVHQTSSSPVSSTSSSPLLARRTAVATPGPRSNGTTSIAGSGRAQPMSNEMTPPSSSPPQDEGDTRMSDVGNDLSLNARVTRRNAAKRVVSYVESDDEDDIQPTVGRRRGRAMVSSSADEDSDSDTYKPERPNKKGKISGRDRVQADSSDSEDDFIVPDDDELDAMEDAALKKRKAGTSKAAPGRSKSDSATPLVPNRANFLSSSSAPNGKSNTTKSVPKEEPYEFLLNPLDENRNPPSHPDYDKRTLHIPPRIMNTLTPFEKQFWNIKKHHMDTVLFFQKGKFYELYEDDALLAHRLFGLKVTDRVKMKMAGVPESSFLIFANKFLALGHKVGRVDQSETAVAMGMRKGAPRQSPTDDDNSKIVRRELKHIYTTGTIVDSDCLPDDMSSFCVSIKEVVRNAVTNDFAEDKDDESISAIPSIGLCFLDAATAEFKIRHIVDDTSRTQFETLLRSLRIKEVIHEKGGLSKKTLRTLRNAVPADCNITMLRPLVEFYNAEQTMRKLNIIFNPALANADTAQDIDDVDPVDPNILPEGISKMLGNDEAISALGGMLSYLTQLNLERDICASRNFDIFDPLARQECMILDAQTLTHLNILTNEQGNTDGTLISLVNRASTAFGKRLMKIWLLAPLTDIDAIRARQEAVEALLHDATLQESFDIFAKSLPDVERIMPRIHAGNCKSRDFARVLKALSRMDENIENLAALAASMQSPVILGLINSIPKVSPESRQVQSMFQDDTFEPRSGCDEDYDSAEATVRGVEHDLQSELAKAATILKLPRDKVKFKDVGTNEIYQIEVPIKTKVPMEWQLVSQTQSVKRYYSPQGRALVKQLKEGRETRLAAHKAFQSRLYAQFCQHGDLFLKAVKGIAELDCLISLAKASYAMGEPTCRPAFVESETARLEFEELRHPCLTTSSVTGFIANDVSLGTRSASEHEGARVTILTGGNMAGKSTTARTTATAVVLAQLGCRVPADKATISPIDRIASRMGANDQLFRNNSTFMVEMLEASRIIRDCTPRSLVIMDELGRGTSTFDGQAIAYAVLHHLISRTRCLCFFLTHYTMLAHEFEGRKGVANMHMQVLVDARLREVVFTYKLVPGIAESSYGTEVAELAGVPSSICERATLISREFAETMRETEEQRLAKLGDRLGVATMSDFSLIFRTALASQSQQVCESEVIDARSLTFLRSHIKAVLANGKEKKSGLSPVKSESMRA